MPNVIPVHPPGKSSGALWLHEIEHVGFGTLCASGPAAHTADVRALEASQFHVADAATLLTSDPTALLYVATVLAQRLDSANRGLLELKRQVSEEPHAQPRLRVDARDRDLLLVFSLDPGRAGNISAGCP